MADLRTRAEIVRAHPDAAFERLVRDMERQCAIGVAEREDIEAVRAALRTGGQGEAVAWAVEFQGDGSLHESGGDDRWNRGRPCLSRDDAEAELRYCVRRGRLSRIRPLVYGDTLGDSKGEG